MTVAASTHDRAFDGTGTPRRVSTDSLGGRTPRWSPDGRRLAYVNARGGTPQIYRMPAAGGNAERVTFADSNRHGQSDSDTDIDTDLHADATTDRHGDRPAQRHGHPYAVSQPKRYGDSRAFAQPKPDGDSHAFAQPDGERVQCIMAGLTKSV